MDKAAYLAVRGDLDFAPSSVITAAIVVFDIALLAAAMLLFGQGSMAAFLLSQVLIAVVFFNSFSLLHECGHGSASSSRWLATIIGHWASIFCFIPYHPWRYIHQQHHLWAGNLDKDPVLKSLKRWKTGGVPKIVRLAWRSWIPMGAALQHIVYAMYPLEMHRQGELTPEKRWRCIFSIVWIPAVWIAAAWLAPDVVQFKNLALAIFLFLVAEELVNLPHHVAMPVFPRRLAMWEQHLTTRSCSYPRGLSELLVLNFNFHIEHHLFPTLPWHRLRRAREIIKPTLGDAYVECVGIGWNIKNRGRDLDGIVDIYRHDEKANTA